MYYIKRRLIWHLTKYHVICHWEGRSKINFPYPSVFELTGPKDWPLKEEYELRSTPRGLPVERSNESRSKWKPRAAYTLWPGGRRRNVGHWVAWPVEVEEEEEGVKWLAEALAPKVVPFSSEEIGIKNVVFRTEVTVRGRAELMPKKSRVPRRGKNWVLGQQLEGQDVLKLSPKLRGRAERILDRR